MVKEWKFNAEKRFVPQGIKQFLFCLKLLFAFFFFFFPFLMFHFNERNEKFLHPNESRSRSINVEVQKNTIMQISLIISFKLIYYERLIFEIYMYIY